jgi:hypothetical protein
MSSEPVAIIVDGKTEEKTTKSQRHEKKHEEFVRIERN